ncbi:hypothetical protein BU17DRAFT_69212 [Hysterangium stoloniferum]|nr:hypothetical protein BU17DRAFT_69212 [Hysterangium stoloniferum]
MSNQKTTTGPHVKDPIAREKFLRVLKHPTREYRGTAPRDAETNSLIINDVSTNKITRDINEWGIEGDEFQIPTTAGDTLDGATPKDVSRKLGPPLQDETSAGLHHDGQRRRKREHEGVVQYGPQAGPLNLD